MKNHLLILFLILSSNTFSIQKDSLDQWIQKGKNKNLSVKDRKIQLLKASEFIIKNKLLTPLKLSSIAYELYKLKDTVDFFKVNNSAINLAKRTDQKFALGDAHWNFATYYVRGNIYDQSYYHFNKAFNSFSSGDFLNESAQMLYGMAHIKGRYRDYMGSEILIIRAIKIFKSTNNTEKLFTSYNSLGTLQFDIKEYNKAIEYYKKSLSYFDNVPSNKKKRIYVEVLNNIGNCYFEQGKFELALKFYNNELKNEYLLPNQVARVIDNRALCKLNLMDTVNIKSDFLKSLKIRDSLGLKTDILTSKLRISEYYLSIKDTLSALKFSKEANMLAKKIKNGGDYLTSLKQLSVLDPKNSKTYLDRYIEFNDSLITVERRMRNKFSRIQFETDEYIEETERLSEQRIWILISSIGGLLILSLLYFVRVQRVQNEKLSIEAEHQKANEEVYVLTLQQQAKLEEERIKERNRISEELHDGILGKLFGTRFGLGFLPLQGTDETLEKHQSLLNELQDIEKEIRDVSHKLSDNFNSTDINFTSIIKQLLEDKSIIGNFTHSIEFDPEIAWKDVNEVTKANIYRIIQEALQNIIKHAKAKHVSLKFGLSGNSLSLSIQDDGVGFNVKKGKKGIGIKNINSRLEKLKGKITIKSELGVGTTLLINTPHITIDGK